MTYSPPTPAWMRYEWCPGRHEKPQAGYYRDGKPRGICTVCGADHSLNQNGTVRHHWREKEDTMARKHREPDPPLTDELVEWWINELKPPHGSNMIPGGVRRLLSQSLTELKTLRAAVAMHTPTIAQTQDDEWECCESDGMDWPCPTAAAIGRR